MHDPEAEGDFSRIFQFHMAMINAFPDVSFGINDLLPEGDEVAVRGRRSGTNTGTGSFRGTPATGGRMSMGFITICRMLDGTVAETRDTNG